MKGSWPKAQENRIKCYMDIQGWENGDYSSILFRLLDKCVYYMEYRATRRTFKIYSNKKILPDENNKWICFRIFQARTKKKHRGEEVGGLGRAARGDLSIMRIQVTCEVIPVLVLIPVVTLSRPPLQFSGTNNENQRQPTSTVAGHFAKEWTGFPRISGPVWNSPPSLLTTPPPTVRRHHMGIMLLWRVQFKCLALHLRHPLCLPPRTLRALSFIVLKCIVLCKGQNKL